MCLESVAPDMQSNPLAASNGASPFVNRSPRAAAPGIKYGPAIDHIARYMAAASATPARRFFAVWLALGLAMTAAPLIGQASPSPEDTIRSFYATLLTTMKSGATFGMKGRYDELASAIRQDFDIPYMARMAVGPGWKGLSDAQKTQVGDAFARYITATYADNFDLYRGERFEVIGEQATAYGTIVLSRIVQSHGESVTMNYLMRQDDGAWRVGDIYLTGTISQLATLRSQFSSVLERGGADGLIATLNRKAEALVTSAVP
jgi:phospholipid transport system substrate-binding protein